MMIPTEFTNSGSRLQGYFFPAGTTPALATVIFLQGFPGVEGDELICEKLAAKGVHVFTFNYRGTFKSGGTLSFPNVIADIGAAYQFLSENPTLEGHPVDGEGIVLGGWSFGASMVPAGALLNPEIGRIFQITGRNFAKEAQAIDRDPEYARQVEKNLASLRAPKGPLRYRDDILQELITIQPKLDSRELAPQLADRDILLIGGWDDEVVPIEDHILPFYRALVAEGAENVRIEAVQDNHEFAKSKDRLVQIILEWLRQG
jgi:fermentation-respiration switch protein FrsA (DUF1100 family)